MDHTTFPLWSIDEFRMEDPDTAFIDKYGDNGGSDIVVAEVNLTDDTDFHRLVSVKIWEIREK